MKDNKIAKCICKHKKLILCIYFILLLLSLVGIYFTKINYDILVYLPSDIETIKGQDILKEQFDMGSYAIAVIDNKDSKDILTLEKEIKEIKGVKNTMSLQDVIGTTIPVEMLPNEVTKYLHNDNKDLMFITFSEGTSSNETIEAVKIIRKLGNSNIELGGMSSMVLDTMNLSQKEIFIYIVIAVILCSLVLTLFLDSYLAPVLLLLNIFIAIIINLGSNIFLGQISYITKALVAVLQLGVTMDFSIFLYHAYIKKKQEYHDINKAMEEAIKETFTSVIGSSLTTIAGFLVLCTMKLTLGKDLGIVMSKGVLLGVISVLTLFPSMLLTFDKYIEKTKHKPLTIKTDKIAKFVVNKYKYIFIVFLILLVPAYLGYKNVEVYYKMDESLPKTLESIKANKVLKEEFDITSPEIILIDSSMKANDVKLMINEIKDVEGVSFILSKSDLLEYGITEDYIDEDLLKLIKNENYELILLNSSYEIASEKLNNQIDIINSIVKKYDNNAITLGEGPLMKDLINISATDFNNVNYSSIICILIILILVQKSITLPFLLIFAIEGAIFINMSVSYFSGTILPFVGPIVLGTIQLGATIDYAILLTTSYIRNRKNNLDKKEAIEKALNYNMSSIIVSALCFFSATFGVGLYSKLEMVGSLCTLISRGAIISMIVVIICLPSILMMFDKIIINTKKIKKGSKNNEN